MSFHFLALFRILLSDAYRMRIGFRLYIKSYFDPSTTVNMDSQLFSKDSGSIPSPPKIDHGSFYIQCICAITEL